MNTDKCKKCNSKSLEECLKIQCPYFMNIKTDENKDKDAKIESEDKERVTVHHFYVPDYLILHRGDKVRQRKITQAHGEGLGQCALCKKRGKWNIQWMCFLYEVEGKEGVYCKSCADELKMQKIIKRR